MLCLYVCKYVCASGLSTLCIVQWVVIVKIVLSFFFFQLPFLKPVNSNATVMPIIVFPTFDNSHLTIVEISLYHLWLHIPNMRTPRFL